MSSDKDLCGDHRGQFLKSLLFSDVSLLQFICTGTAFYKGLDWTGLNSKWDISPLFQGKEKKTVVAWKSSESDLMISFLTFSVPLGSFPPHVSGPLTVDCFVEVLFILCCCMQITKVGHTEANCYQSKRHHRFVLTRKNVVNVFSQNIFH